MIDVVTISTKGQLVIPKKLREDMDIKEQDKFIISHDKDKILLKRIDRMKLRKSMQKLLDYTSKEFKKAGITMKDVEDEIAAVRRLNKR